MKSVANKNLLTLFTKTQTKEFLSYFLDERVGLSLLESYIKNVFLKLDNH